MSERDRDRKENSEGGGSGEGPDTDGGDGPGTDGRGVEVEDAGPNKAGRNMGEGAEGELSPEENNDAASNLRMIYEDLEIRLRERVLALMEDVMKLMDEEPGSEFERLRKVSIINEVEDMEAIVGALDSLTRNPSDSDIQDPSYVSRYLDRCLFIRRKGRAMEVNRIRDGFAEKGKTPDSVREQRE